MNFKWGHHHQRRGRSTNAAIIASVNRRRTPFRFTRAGMALQLIALFIAAYFVALEFFR